MSIRDLFASAKYRYSLRVAFSKASLEDIEKANKVFQEEFLRAKLQKLNRKTTK